MFKEILVDLLRKSGIKQAILAKETGISEALISNWKSGRQEPKYDSLQKLSRYFNVSADYLLGLTDIPNPPALFPEIKTAVGDEQRQRLNDNYDRMNEKGQQALLSYAGYLIQQPENLKEGGEDNQNVS